ncbi:MULTISPECIES: hypothetical protein [unclassified Saccharibacter]|uniref:hypothetical protein n=1 Tax=unclassified Saccharibacter TaxID=2648722 RepID=UPI001326025E|nr:MULTISPECIES: hypothetical protein [unclassified Saccharibacter]MXV35828.1 hypothetical protein [Saccharibacter sp. EH611]MXV57949.1 hypothetical protein [Saccharibacter sp. EH70]MXV66344.1 hypothetical protein [Saccharibacter sp. EH60]
MNVKAICAVILAALFVGMAATILRLTWKASKEKTAQQQRNDARSVTALQAEASQAATDACNTDSQLDEELTNGTF